MLGTHDNEFPDERSKPFSRCRPAKFPIGGDQLVEDSDSAIRNHVDVLGCQFFQARDDILAELAKLGDDERYRARLGTVKAAKLERFSALTDEQRRVGLDLAEEAMNHLIDRIAQTVACGERNFPGGYWIEYRLESRVLKVAGAGEHGVKLKKVARQDITGDAESVLACAFGRWLNMFGEKNR